MQMGDMHHKLHKIHTSTVYTKRMLYTVSRLWHFSAWVSCFTLYLGYGTSVHGCLVFVIINYPVMNSKHVDTK